MQNKNITKKSKNNTHKKKRFIPGIYNYCDRWCERCPHKDECYLYYKEQARRSQHQLYGEDPDDPDIIMRDILNEFRETQVILNKKLKENKIDIRELRKQGLRFEKPRSFDFENKLAIKISQEYFNKTHKFLENFYKKYYNFLQEYNIEIGIDDIKDEIEVISWYHNMLPSKVWHIYYEYQNWKDEKDRKYKNMIKEDLPKYYDLIYKCYKKSVKSLKSLSSKRTEMQKEANDLLKILNKFNNELKKDFKSIALSHKKRN